MTATGEQAAPASVPQVVASYATYLRTRTGASPATSVTGDHAALTLSIGDRILVLAFECQRREWSLRSAEVRNGDQATAFARGKLAGAVTALLRP